MTLKQENGPVETGLNQNNSEHQETPAGISSRREFVPSPDARMTTDTLAESGHESTQQRAAIVRLHWLIAHNALVFHELSDEVAAIAFRDAFEALVCGFHDTWTPSPRSFGHSFHAHLDRQSERSDAGLHC